MPKRALLAAFLLDRHGILLVAPFLVRSLFVDNLGRRNRLFVVDVVLVASLLVVPRRTKRENTEFCW